MADFKAILARADARLDADAVARNSLAPGRSQATRLEALGEAIVDGTLPEDVAIAWARGLAGVALAMHDAFPDNLLWDLDHLAARLWVEATGSDGLARVRRLAARIAEVQVAFGRATPIAFRYVHDFSYGFDWAKWVGREPGTRAGVGPFAEPFVEAMLVRAAELRASIVEGTDAKYPPLPDGRARNPFGFSREPADELALFRALAEHDAVPVPAWRLDAHPQWDRPYSRWRHEIAESLAR